MILAKAWLDYNPIVHIEIGPLSISPHGIGIAVGFLLGAAIFLRWCREAGFDEEDIFSMINRAAIGSIIGARLAYVLNHPGDFDNPFEVFMVWKGGISLLGGIAGAILTGVPRMRKSGLSFWKVMDLAVPCVTLGIVVGRIGDLVVADHLGKTTGFFLGYVCPGEKTAVPCIAEVGEAVHQPALYDFFSATILLLVLLRLRKVAGGRGEKSPRYDGFMTVFFGAWYGFGRVMEDFFRIDETHGTGLTGSQWTALVVMSACLWVLLFKRDTPWRSGRAQMASAPDGEVVASGDEPAADVPDGEVVASGDEPAADVPEGEDGAGDAGSAPDGEPEAIVAATTESAGGDDDRDRSDRPDAPPPVL